MKVKLFGKAVFTVCLVIVVGSLYSVDRCSAIEKSSLKKEHKKVHTYRIQKRIHPQLPKFHFKLYGYREKGYTGQYVTDKIKIRSKGKILQVIDFTKNRDKAFPCPRFFSKNFGFAIEDMNFDGYKDIRIIEFMPLSPNTSYFVWTWNQKTNQYVQNKALEKYPAAEFNQKKKRIYSSVHISGAEYNNITYKYMNGKPVKIKMIKTGFVNKKDLKHPYRMKYKRIHGKMKLIMKRKI